MSLSWPPNVGGCAPETLRNAIACLAICFVVLSFAARWIAAGRADASDELYVQAASAKLLAFRLACAAGKSFTLFRAWSDPQPFESKYSVPGRPQIPLVVYEFRHFGRWTTFTLWCNTLGAIYFWLAAVVSAGDVGLIAGGAPSIVRAVAHILWEVTFPLAFLVNLVVSFVLIPNIKRQGLYDKLRIILRWRPLVLHNGFVLMAAGEAVLAATPLRAGNFPVIVLFGLTYVVFAWCLWLRTGIFHYFFLDPRFSMAPVALMALLLLLAALYGVGCVVVAGAARSWLAQVAIVAAALSTCTWSDPAVRQADEAAAAAEGKAK